MTAPGLAAVPETAAQQHSREISRRIVPAPALRFRLLAGGALAVVLMAVVEVLGRPPGIEPLAFVPIVAAVGVIVAGLPGGGWRPSWVAPTPPCITRPVRRVNPVSFPATVRGLR
ncbi:MAG: hypothetical protein ABIP53_01675 [Candidatus Limnocylindrales bacterium]